MEKTKLTTIDIKGKKYSTVDSRVEFFREKYPNWSIETDFPVLDLDKGVCVCRAVIKDESGKIVSDGFAHEWQSKPGSLVNKTSYIENAQTSAVGRALGFIGIGINGMGIATAEEVDLAIKHDEAKDYQVTNQTINDIVNDEIPDMPIEKPTRISTECQRAINDAGTLIELKAVYENFVDTEPVDDLKSQCAAKKELLMAMM